MSLRTGTDKAKVGPKKNAGLLGQRLFYTMSKLDNQFLLNALSVRIRLCLIDNRTVIEVGHFSSEIGDVLRYPRHAIVIDVLRLVGHLMVVSVSACGEE